MQLEWSDLRVLLAFLDEDGLPGAATRLGMAETTVSRRLTALSESLGADLMARDGAGRLRPTDTARGYLPLVARMETAAREIADQAQATGDVVAGQVRLSAVPFLVEHVLIPALPALHAAHPKVTLELVSDPRNTRLTAREADMALRLGAPEAGGNEVLARRIGSLAHVAVAAETQPDGWIAYDRSLSHLPHARWIDRQGGPVTLRVSDASAAAAAARRGLGRALIPEALVTPDLRILPALGPFPTRPVWRMVLRDARRRPAIRAVADWLAEVFD